MLPQVITEQVDGVLGKRSPSQDGIAALLASGIAVAGQFALNDVLKLKSIDEAIAKGITAAYDATNTCMVYKHVSDFFLEAGKGSTLYLMVVAKSVKLSDMVDNANANTAKKALLAAAGDIRLLGCTWIPASGYTPTYVNQFDADLTLALTNAKALRAAEFTANRPLHILLEGRDWQGSASSALDLRDIATVNEAHVSVVIGQDNAATTTYTWATKYASVGSALGRLARIPVQRSIGRVKDGSIRGMITPGLSNNTKISATTDANLELLNDKGYIYAKTHAGITGNYWNRDHACVPLTSDYSYLHDGRVMDKATRVTRAVYVQMIQDDVLIDATTGKLDVSTCNSYESEVKAAIADAMVGEIVAVDAFCDPNQIVRDTDEIVIEIQIVRRETPGVIRAKLAFAVSL